ADGAQSSRVPVPLPKDPYEAIRQAYLDGTDTESEPFEDPIDTKTPESPLAIAPPIPLSEKVEAMSESAFRKRFRSTYESSPSMSPPDLPLWKRYHEDEGPTTEDEDPAADDEDDEGYSVESDELGLEEEKEAVPGGRQQAASVVGITVSAPLGLGYGALRRRELALEEGDVYSTFEVGHGSGSAPKSERLERVSAFRQPTLTTWTDPEDGMIYIDIPDYPPPAPPVQTPPSPEWTSGLLPISPLPSDDPSLISSPMIPLTVPSPVATPATVETDGFLTKIGAQVQMQGGLISDHAVRLEKLSPALFEGEGCSDIQSDMEARENRDLQLQLAEERRARLELAEVVDGIRRRQEPKGGA
ncbi:hypothetical protein Tco_1234053, partial [Tanacetum coccineum]